MSLAVRAAALAVSLLAGGAVPAAAAPPRAGSGTVVLLPPSATLTGPKATQQFLVEARGSAGFTGDLTARARFRSSNPRVMTVDARGIARPVSNGVATLTAVVGGKRAAATVRVRESRKPFRWSFANHVQPVLTRTSCNSGACH